MRNADSLEIRHHLEMASTSDSVVLTEALSAAGCVAAPEEAQELLRAADSPRDLAMMLARRVAGEPLAWITGSIQFCGLTLTIEPGVYVPRWQSEPLARLAADLLPADGTAVDLGTGVGSIAAVMHRARPGARVIGTEIDSKAAKCARRNGLEVHEGDLYDSLPVDLVSSIDVVTAVLPYVPSELFHLLPRDVRQFEPRLALDGGNRGLEVLSRAIRDSRSWLRDGGWLLLEVGIDQVRAVVDLLEANGYRNTRTVCDGDGDPRGIAAELHLG